MRFFFPAGFFTSPFFFSRNGAPRLGSRERGASAARRAGATVVDVSFHEFSPFGISGMVIIAESHLSIHTWPEYGYAAVDIFTCGEMNAVAAINYLTLAFVAAKTQTRLIERRVDDADTGTVTIAAR